MLQYVQAVLVCRSDTPWEIAMTRLLPIGALILAGIACFANGSEIPSTQQTKATVLVLPFTMQGDLGGSWIARAATDDVVAGLTRGLDVNVRTPHSNHGAADAAAALKLAQQYHANYVIFGYAQEVGNIARITGQVLDVESGQPLGGLKVTGPAPRLLDIDDALTAQAMASLPQSMVKPGAFAELQQYLLPPDSEAEAPSADGLAMVSQSYPVGSTTFFAPLVDSTVQASNSSYVYAPTIIVSSGYGYGGAFANDYYGPLYGYPSFIFGRPHSHGHLPVIHHGPQRPSAPAGLVDTGDGVVIAGGVGAGGSTPVTFSWGQNPGPVSTPFMGGGQSFPTQNGFVTSGAAGFSPFTGPRFNTLNFGRGFGGRSGPTGR